MTEQSLNKETQNGKGNLIRMEFNGVLVTFKGKEEVNLTDLWRAAGGPENKNPYEWSRREGSEIIAAYQRKLNTAESRNLKPIQNEVLRTVRGKAGGTWGPRTIAVSYAGYLSPDLQIWINEVFLERLQEEQNPDLIAERFIATHKRRGFDSKWINARFKSIQSNKEHNEVLNRHGVEGPGFAMCAHNINVGILGTTKKKYLENRGIDPTENIRDHMSEAELVAETLAELLSDSKIEKDNIIGNKPCAKTCHIVAKELSETVHRLAN